MAKKQPSDTHGSNFYIVLVAVLCLIIVVMVLTRLYFVERETMALKRQVINIIKMSDKAPLPVNAPLSQ
jgi:cell division protein FtsL